MLFSEERVEVDFDDDFSLVHDEVTTSFIKIRDGHPHAKTLTMELISE